MTPEVLIVGAGPAGVSAALWAGSLGWAVSMLDSTGAAGGQLREVHSAPPNVAGAVPGEGTALARRLGEQLQEAGIRVRAETAAALDRREPEVTTQNGERLKADAVVIAAGVRRRRLDVPGLGEGSAAWISYSATHDRARFAGEEILVVGGGDGALESALLLADVGCRVTVAARGKPRARESFRLRVEREPRIEVLEETTLTAVEDRRDRHVARLQGPRGTFALEVAGVVVKIGVLPNTEWCAEAVARDREGYVRVGSALQTSHPRCWAAGDVVRPPLFGVAIAEGQGALAIASIRQALGD